MGEDDRLVQEIRRAELGNFSLRQDAALASAAFFLSDPPMPAFICNTCGTQFVALRQGAGALSDLR